MEATDMPDGKYSIAGNPVLVKDGVALTEDGALAGSTLSLDQALKNLMDFASLSLKDALPCATENPAREIGIFDTVGSIEQGKIANLLILSSDKDLFIDHIVLRGKKIK
jgi:N-acetylglucosamine-6-phosphate deacetylase